MIIWIVSLLWIVPKFEKTYFCYKMCVLFRSVIKKCVFFLMLLHEPYMSLSCAWWNKYFFEDFQASLSFLTMPMHVQACVLWSKYINFKITWITFEPSFDHLFATYSYTNYWRVSEFLTNSNPRSNYLPKFASKDHLKLMI